jgi:hypothetical protein
LETHLRPACTSQSWYEMCISAGRVGFEKEMGALEAMRDGTEEKVSAVQLMLACTHEMFKRFKEVHRDKTIWRSDVRNGRSMMMQWRVCAQSPPHIYVLRVVFFSLNSMW